MIKRHAGNSIYVDYNPLRFGHVSNSGETEFLEVVIPDQKRYEELIESVAKEKALLDNGKDGLQAAEKALGVVIRFLQHDRAVVHYGLHAPLLLLAAALHDVRRGAKPELFKPYEGSAQNRPAGEAFNLLRGQITAAFAALVTAGFRVREAALKVERLLKDLRITLPDGSPINERLIRRWRENINQQKADSMMVLGFDRAKSQGEAEPARLASKEAALAWCETLLKSVAIYTHPPKPPVRGR